MTAAVGSSTFAFSPENKAKAYKAIAKYPSGRQASAVLALLDFAQRQSGGWLPREAMDYVANYLQMPLIRVYEVATFYSMFNLKPIGKHHVRVCTTTPCQLRGALALVKACETKLGVKLGETTSDGMFTLGEVECLGACVNAPVIQVGDDYFEDVDAAAAARILDSFGQGQWPKPGPQIDRRNSAPVGGATTLKDLIA